MQSTGKLQLSPDTVYDFTSEDLQDLGEIGRGGFGTVNKMIHRISNTVMAVKVVRIIYINLFSNLFFFIINFFNFLTENSFDGRREGTKPIVNGFGSRYEIQRMSLYRAILWRSI